MQKQEIKLCETNRTARSLMIPGLVWNEKMNK